MKRIIATPNKDVVVFIIGLRINRLRSVRQWLPTVQTMGPMLQECYANDVGLISHESLVGWRSVTLIQYWRSTEELMAYAHGSRHLTAWKRFNQKRSGSFTRRSRSTIMSRCMSIFRHVVLRKHLASRRSNRIKNKRKDD
ncbi:DUF4188 domain-containing protein [Exiguobacterium sp. PHA03]